MGFLCQVCILSPLPVRFLRRICILSPLPMGFAAYIRAGVREYWALDPERRTIVVYYLETPDVPAVYPPPSPLRYTAKGAGIT